MAEPTDRLRAVIARVEPQLRAVDDAAASRPPAPGKWSPKALLGHLIDSASVNHERFLRAQFQADLVLPGYDQNAWVDAQGYGEAPWEELVTLWAAFNRHIARVMDRVSAEERRRARHPHSVDTIGFQTVPAEEPATLDGLMRDYVDHLEHHLGHLPGVEL